MSLIQDDSARIAPASPDTHAAPRPLVVDLDGTLIRTDLVQEGLIRLGATRPLAAARVVARMLRDRAGAKRDLARAVPIDAARLPYDEAVVALAREARAEGRRVELVSGSDEAWVAEVAHHTALFDLHEGSNGTTNLTGARKAARLVERFGRGGFDYVGNAWPDLAVWGEAGGVVLSKPEPGLMGAVRRRGLDAIVLPDSRPGGLAGRVRVLARMLRVHQWAKNALIVVPMLTAHLFTLAAAGAAALGVLAFSLCASSVYVLNDLIDVESDRAHPRKRARPFASGTAPVAAGLVAAPLLLAAAVALASLLPSRFMVLLAVYFAVTCAYSFKLKRLLILDVVALAGLYVARVLAGGAAVGVPVSQWLLSFSLFLFASLALVKRHSELAMKVDAGLSDPGGRSYRTTDLDVLLALAAAAGFNAVTILSLYVASPDVKAMYAKPGRLWLLLPIVTYWIARIVLLSHRRRVHHDPVVFALTDGASLACGAAALGVLAAALPRLS